ncbi:MAG: hypothetical protein CHACPFDD_02296 [Phycisphaerae bacterium]|nr:hypothetical protein [Phycisphaerae bacterium]
MTRSGRGAFRWRGVVSALVLLPVCTLAVFSPPWVGEGTWYDVLGDFVAWIVLGAGVFLRLWATLYVGGRKSVELVTTGPYALCRHPLYVASLLILVSLAIFLLSATVLAAAGLLATVYAFVVVPSEERHALNCFGDEYRGYTAATPRFIPKTLRIAPPGVIETKVGAFLREYARTFGLIALGAAIDLLAYCRTQPWWPTPFHLP